MKYYLQIIGGRPIEWPARKPLTLYFAAVREYFGLNRWMAEQVLEDRALTDSVGRRFFALRDGVNPGDRLQ